MAILRDFGTLGQNVLGAQNRRKPILPYSIFMLFFGAECDPGVRDVRAIYNSNALARNRRALRV
ncbi:hypothetical protein [Paraburkholderia silvatlantica]|uniref:Uncharacterized protein n=2 Tax=Paraburkholderia silvatlantica TaxID=321895 RepID=A0ABR6FHT5_9BURK|nr:hypothetical protein [Paraburkholderia silvatlantica]